LLALTIAVLMGVAVRARDAAPVRTDAGMSTVAARQTTTDIDGRRYPPVQPGIQPQR